MPIQSLAKPGSQPPAGPLEQRPGHAFAVAGHSQPARRSSWGIWAMCPNWSAQCPTLSEPPNMIIELSSRLTMAASVPVFALFVWYERIKDRRDGSPLVPLRLFVVAEKVGGQVLGAFQGSEMVGFALAVPGVRAGHAYLHSHMLAVRQQYRNAGLGRRMKLFRRKPKEPPLDPTNPTQLFDQTEELCQLPSSSPEERLLHRLGARLVSRSMSRRCKSSA